MFVHRMLFNVTTHYTGGPKNYCLTQHQIQVDVVQISNNTV